MEGFFGAPTQALKIGFEISDVEITETDSST